MLVGLVLGAGLGGLPAQGLQGLKKSYEEEIGKTVVPLREGYRKALLTLEQSLAAKGDYAGAMRVQEERRSLEKQMGSITGTTPGVAAVRQDDGRLKLTSGGEGSGGLREDGGAWTGWQTAGGAVRWALPAGMIGGGYALELIYRSSAAGTLPLTVKVDFHRLHRSVKVDAAAESEGRVRLGVLRVRPGAAGLELNLTGAGSAPDFRLLAVHLIPEGGEK